MPIPVTCSRCGAQYQVPESRAGTTGTCRCGEQLPVPAVEATPKHTGIPSMFPQQSPLSAPQEDLVPLGPPRPAAPAPQPALPGGAQSPNRPTAAARPKQKREVIGSGPLVRYATYALMLAIAAALAFVLLAYPRWVAERIDGDWRTPSGAVLTFKSGRVVTNVNGRQEATSGYVAFKRGGKWDEALLLPADLTGFTSSGGNRYWLLPDGTIRIHMHYTVGPGSEKKVSLTAKPIDGGKLELSENQGGAVSRQLLSKVLVLTRAK